MDDEKKYWLGFSAFPGIGPLRFKLLREYFGSAKAAWEAAEEKLLQIGLGDKTTAKFVDFRKNFSFDKYLKLLADKKISVLTLQDKNYPKLLAEISDAPFVLYIRGDIKNIKNFGKTFGVVGTRKITNYGRIVTHHITQELANAGVTIVSGMAYGVDTVAHEAAVSAGGKTIAVLGCGVDIIHPISNTKLYWQIIGGAGIVVSEFPPTMRADVGLFPARNRIISGLSLGVVVTEGAQDSGALITARYAAEQGREVFAVPGPITSDLSAGPTLLLKQGAKLVTEASDILEELNIRNKPINQSSNKPINVQMKKLSNDEKKILEFLQHESLHFDEIVKKSGINASKLGSILTLMEMKKIIKNLGSGHYGILT